jgi:hypothetical protein
MKPTTVGELRSILRRKGRPLGSFKKGDHVRGCTSMALKRNYSYLLSEEPGSLPIDFQPDLSPGEMLMLGVFEGKYLNDCIGEFPVEWYMGALMTDSLSPEGPDPARCNMFEVKSRQPLSVWTDNGWAPSRGRSGATDDHYKGALGDPDRNPDERGWFQWYCRYWMGRRIPELDAIQIRRWRAFRRHAGALRGGCPPWNQNKSCRLRERQALLQWAYNPFV